MTKKLTVAAAIKRFHNSPATQVAIAAVKSARAEAERIRAHVDTYIAAAFAQEKFVDGEGQRITNPRDLYLCDDDSSMAAWYARCDKLHAANGYKLEPGHCPALVAEEKQRKAEQVLLDLLGNLTGVDGADFNRTLEMRARALELVLNPPKK